MRDNFIITKGATEGYCAWNEDGRLIATGPHYDALEEDLMYRGYHPVPLNSRCGRTIMDKVLDPK